MITALSPLPSDLFVVVPSHMPSVVFYGSIFADGGWGALELYRW